MSAPEAPTGPLGFSAARQDLQDLLSLPVQRWTTAGPARRTVAEYQSLLTIPLDLAASGFTVTISQSNAGWETALKRRCGNGEVLQVQAVARSYVAALFQVADRATRAVGEMERQAHRLDNRQT